MKSFTTITGVTTKTKSKKKEKEKETSTEFKRVKDQIVNSYRKLHKRVKDSSSSRLARGG